MKNILLLVILVSMSFYSTAQKKNEEKVIGNNEVRLNALWLMIGSVNLAYERVINDNTSLGIVVNKPFDYDNFRSNFGISPYYRLYFSNKRAQGFFFEANTTIHNDRFESYNFTNQTFETINKTKLGFGIALGGKIIIRNGLVIDIYIGPTRDLNTYSNGIDGAAGISIGKRF